MAERSFDDFDEYATEYRQIHTENIKMSGADSFYFSEMKVKLLEGYEKNIPLNFLDVGCGDGVTEIYVRKYFPLWKKTGIDISEKSIEEAKNKNLDCDFKVYDGSNIPFPDEHFDIVFMAGVLHHVSFSLHKAMIKEIYRVLKKGGQLYLFEHNRLNPVTRRLVNTCIFDKDARLLPLGYTRYILKRNHFKITANKFIIFFPRKGLLSKFIFLEKYLQWLPLGGQYFIVAGRC